MEDLKGVTHDVLRRTIIEALSRLRQGKGQRLFGYKELVLEVVQQLGLSGKRADALAGTQVHVYTAGLPGRKVLEDEQADNAKILAAVWSLTADGTLFPRFHTPPTQYRNGIKDIEIYELILTPMGEEVLKAAPNHPRFSGALSRLRGQHPNLDPEIVARLEDAVLCINANLARPAIVMIGLAMEETLAKVEEKLLQQGKYTGSAPIALAKKRLAEIKKTLETKFSGDDQHRLLMAVSTAERCRHLRNKAAHDVAESFSLPEADGLLGSTVHAIETVAALVL